MAGSNWHPIEECPKGIGAVLLRVGPGILDGVCIGQQYDDGRWYAEGVEMRQSPNYFCQIPPFDLDEAAG